MLVYPTPRVSLSALSIDEGDPGRVIDLVVGRLGHTISTLVYPSSQVHIVMYDKANTQG